MIDKDKILNKILRRRIITEGYKSMEVLCLV